MQGKENAESGMVTQEDMGYMASVHKGGFSTDQDVIDGIVPEEDNAFKSKQKIVPDDEDSDRELGDLDEDTSQRSSERDDILVDSDEDEPEEQPREPRERVEAPELAPADPNAITDSVDTLDVFAELSEEIQQAAQEDETEETEPEEEEVAEDDDTEAPFVPENFFKSLNLTVEEGEEGSEDEGERYFEISENEIRAGVTDAGDYFITIDADYLKDRDGLKPRIELVSGTAEGQNRVWRVYTEIEHEDSNIEVEVTFTDTAGNSTSTTGRVGFDVDNDLDDDAATTDYAQFVTIDVLANDTLNDTDWSQSGAVLSVADPENGSVEITYDENGVPTVIYTPDDGFSGTETFTYTITENVHDEIGHDSNAPLETRQATVTVTVNPNTPPVVEDYAGPGDGIQYLYVDIGPAFGKCHGC
jgi:hypothetical protein